MWLRNLSQYLECRWESVCSQKRGCFFFFMRHRRLSLCKPLRILRHIQGDVVVSETRPFFFVISPVKRGRWDRNPPSYVCHMKLLLSFPFLRQTAMLELAAPERLRLVCGDYLFPVWWGRCFCAMDIYCPMLCFGGTFRLMKRKKKQFDVIRH